MVPASQYEQLGDPRRDDGARYTLQLLRIRQDLLLRWVVLLMVISRGAERIGGMCQLPPVPVKTDLRTGYFRPQIKSNTELQLFNYKSN